MNFRFTLSFLFLLFLVSSCEKNPDVVGSVSLTEYTPEDRLIIGDAIDVEAKKLYPTISEEDKPEAIAYINDKFNIVINTATVKTRTLYNWKVSIINDTSLTSAFTLPNGHVYISSGLLLFLESESQLLSLLAHEVAYAENNFMTLAIEDEFSKIALGDIILDNGLADVTGMAALLPNLNFDANVVLEADEFSVELLCPFVYEPRGIVKIVEKSMENTGAAITWLSTKSVDNSTRIQEMNLMSEPCGLDGTKNEEEYQEFLSTLSE